MEAQCERLQRPAGETCPQRLQFKTTAFRKQLHLKGGGGGVPKADETVSQWEDEFEIWGFLLAISSTVGGALVCPASAL